MLIDGNDTRGIDVGIMTTKDVEISSMRSNVDVPDPETAPQHLFGPAPRAHARELGRRLGVTDVEMLGWHALPRRGHRRRPRR